VRVTKYRNKIDFAHCMQYLIGELLPEADTICVVMHQLNTNTPGTLYEAFEPAEAKRILDRLEFHFTPKHGGWLNMAEIQLSVLSRQCLDQRVLNQTALTEETMAWEAEHNASGATVNWRFTTEDACINLRGSFAKSASRLCSEAGKPVRFTRLLSGKVTGSREACVKRSAQIVQSFSTSTPIVAMSWAKLTCSITIGARFLGIPTQEVAFGDGSLALTCRAGGKL
jgi:hypothetical protein